MQFRSLFACGFCLFASGASAQPIGDAAWLWDVVTDDGDPVVEPGESATLTLSVQMTPRDPGDKVLGFGGAIFDTLGGQNATNGSVAGWEVHNNLDSFFGDLTTTDGISLFGTFAAQVPTRFFITDNPIQVLSLTWMPSFYGEYNVHYMTATQSQAHGTPGFIELYLGTFDMREFVEWPIHETQIVLAVVPSPPTAGLLALAILSLASAHSRHRLGGTKIHLSPVPPRSAADLDALRVHDR